MWVPERLNKVLLVIQLVCVGTGTETIVIFTDKGRPDDEVQMGWLLSLRIFYL